MACIENRSPYQVTVKNRDDLTKSFPHDQLKKAEAYCHSLQAQRLEPKPSRLNEHFIIPVRQKGLEEQVLHADSLKRTAEST